MSRQSHLLRRVLPVLLASVGVACTGLGCAPAAKPKEQPKAASADGHDHDHAHDDHDHPETLAAGIAELETTAKDIATKLAAGSQNAADDAVHAAGHLLEDLEGLLEKEKDISAEARAAGKKALDELFECFDKLDTAMHAGADEAKATAADVHASVKERIEGAMKSLKDEFTKEGK